LELGLEIQLINIGIYTFKKDYISNRTATVTGLIIQRIQEMGLQLLPKVVTDGSHWRTGTFIHLMSISGRTETEMIRQT